MYDRKSYLDGINAAKAIGKITPIKAALQENFTMSTIASGHLPSAWQIQWTEVGQRTRMTALAPLLSEEARVTRRLWPDT